MEGTRGSKLPRRLQGKNLFFSSSELSFKPSVTVVSEGDSNYFNTTAWKSQVGNRHSSQIYSEHRDEKVQTRSQNEHQISSTVIPTHTLEMRLVPLVRSF